MSRAERERQERRQRMLAREQGREWVAGDTLPGTDTGAGVHVPQRVRRTATAAPAPRPAAAPAGNARPLSPILRRRRRNRQLLVGGLIAAVLLAIVLVSGVLNGVFNLLGDAADSAVLYLNRNNGGWPADTGITAPLRVEPLAGGFVAMDGEDVVVYSAYGSRIHTVQPGYGRPALAVGNTRFVIYNRAGTELRVESRTRTLDTLSFDSGILLCAMSANGSLAVVTEAERYAAILEVRDPGLRTVITYALAQADGAPVALDFAADNRRLAAGLVAALDGQMRSRVYFLDTAQETLGPYYTADAGSLVLRVEWLSAAQVLAVFDTYLAVLDAGTGAELARYGYGGAVLQGEANSGRRVALLLSIRGGNTLVTLNEDLTPLAMIPAAQTAAVAATETAAYLLDVGSVQCYGYDGVRQWQRAFSARPQAIIQGNEPLLYLGSSVQPLADVIPQ